MELDVKPVGRWGLMSLMVKAVVFIVVGTGAKGGIAALPDPPLLKRDVHLIDRGRLTRPAIPATRVTNDGRVSVDFSSVTQVEFTLIKPETIDQPFDRSSPGYAIIGGDGVAPFNVDRDLFHTSTHNGFGDASHHTICEGSSSRYESSPSGPSPAASTGYGTSNPYPCAGDPNADCYDLTLIGTTMTRRNSVELWGTPFTVKVTSPKTRWARIESVDVGTPAKGTVFSGIGSWFEPLTTGDGRLLIGRSGFRNMFYSVMDEDDAPCDVGAWTERHEITHAHHDPRMWKSGKARYGIAEYPMKDGAGNLIPDSAPSKLTYPWMDKAGDNIFFTSVDSTLFYHQGSFKSRYPVSCYAPGCYTTPVGNNIRSVDTVEPLRGIGMFGSWSHGKVLLIDNLNNNIDYGTGWGDNQQYFLSLYSGSGSDSKVRIGGAGFVTQGQFPGPGGLSLASTYPYVYIIDSVENLFNDIPSMVPSTIRDVAWYLSLGKGTDKVIFDEWLNPDVLIYSEWIPTMIHTDTSVPSQNSPSNYMHYRDGFVTTSRGHSVDGTGFGEEVWFQNDATGLKHKVAPYGLAKQGKNANELIRAEPVAQGGVRGRGLWLFDYNNVTYSIPSQASGVDIGKSWYVGLYVDYSADSSSSTERRLLTFPDGSSVRLKGSKVQLFASGGESAEKEFDLNDVGKAGKHTRFSNKSKNFSSAALGTRQWWHLGFQALEDGAKVEFLVNGFRKGVWSSTESEDAETKLLRMTKGDFVLGSPSQDILGFKGWTDSLLVVAQDVNPEVACNYANGTLVGLTSSASMLQGSAASYYPNSASSELSSFLRKYSKSTYTGYFCLQDYTTDLGIDSREMPQGVVSIREDVIFPEGPLTAGAPRPDTKQNDFCLSCHTDDSETETLKVAALGAVSHSVERDTRRQPAQGPRLVRGNIPAHYLGREISSQDTRIVKGRSTVTDLYTLSPSVALVGPNGDADFDGVVNKDDPFPNDVNRSSDLDGDRIDDLADDDLDGDGVLNCLDAFPKDAGEWADADGDGTGDNWDVDADNDGVMDPIKASFDAPGPRLTTRTPLDAEWKVLDSEQSGDGDHYAGGYTIKRDWAGPRDTGIKHPMLQGGFDASARFARVGDSKGPAMIYWRFEDSGSAMQVEYHTKSSTLVAAIKRPGSNRFESFGSTVFALTRASLNSAPRLRIDVGWADSDDGGPGSGTWTVRAGLREQALREIGTASVTTNQNSSASRTMQFAITGNTTEYVWLDYLTVDPHWAGRLSVANGGFDSLGSSVHGPLTKVSDWTIVGDASVIGGLATPQSYGFASGGTDNGLFVGVDFVDGRSTAGKIFQDVGSTAPGTTYTLNTRAYGESSFPAGYKLSFRDASNDKQLASASNSLGKVSIQYTETEKRTLRVQIESNGSVSSGQALRTLLDDVALDISGGSTPTGASPKPADLTCPRPPKTRRELEVCFFESSDWRVGGSFFKTCIGKSAYNFNDKHNDAVSAVSVGAGVHTVIYADRNYQGASLCIGPDTNNNDLGTLNDAASSFKVLAGDCP